MLNFISFHFVDFHFISFCLISFIRFCLQSYYEHDRKSLRFYLRIFYDLIDLSIGNAYIIYNKLSTSREENFSISFFDFRTRLCVQLIDEFTNRRRQVKVIDRSLERPDKIARVIAPEHRMERSNKRQRCHVCAQKKKESKTNAKCVACEKYFCFVKERNCFSQYHGK